MILHNFILYSCNLFKLTFVIKQNDLQNKTADVRHDNYFFYFRIICRIQFGPILLWVNNYNSLWKVSFLYKYILFKQELRVFVC